MTSLNGAVPFGWCPVRRKELPDSLLRAVGYDGLPSIDVFVCTADPRREPPASVASTALSAMAFDYPTDRLSVYLSDDGGSAVTLFAFMEAARFARYWLPFCKSLHPLDDKNVTIASLFMLSVDSIDVEWIPRLPQNLTTKYLLVEAFPARGQEDMSCLVTLST
ncbi:hypothetical protein ZIOFF_056202 [Zingiber officinale]|uniref:Cellulose synthase n=1 Tax=Zingiber officinale TaxID=94328 RepID=A0A8J5FNG5_ZINOF|nr:hypothetical protein ZIOFF_056202 [Zingiber officinale]